MSDLRFTLLADGSSDRALLPLLTWLLRHHGVQQAIQSDWADLRRLPRGPTTLEERIKASLALYPCDLLFVHRDAERVSHATRVAEITDARERVAREIDVPPTICVVPVRMQEAWFLFDEAALRAAAGNPHGRAALALPLLASLEGLTDPKSTLNTVLRQASGLHGRRRRQVPANRYAHRVAEFIDDFSPLRALSAFVALEAEVRRTIHAHGWAAAP